MPKRAWVIKNNTYRKQYHKIGRHIATIVQQRVYTKKGLLVFRDKKKLKDILGQGTMRIFFLTWANILAQYQ